MIKNIIFDLDETLAESYDASRDGFRFISEKFFPAHDPEIAAEELYKILISADGDFDIYKFGGFGIWAHDIFVHPALEKYMPMSEVSAFRNKVLQRLGEKLGTEISENKRKDIVENFKAKWAGFYAVNKEAEVLRLLSEYNLYILTDGFTDVQNQKIESCGFSHFFKKIYISEMFGRSKADSAVFRELMADAGITAKETMMIGDNKITDFGGSKGAGVHALLYDRYDRHADIPEEEKIKNLMDLPQILAGLNR